MISFAGSKGSLKLFVDDEKAVVIDSSVNLVLGSGDANVLLSSRNWDSPAGSVDNSTWELASSTITTLDINVITASARMYTIPDGAKAEAKKALEWRKEHKRGGTPVGLNTARTLARGGQIGIEKIRHIAKYFPRHEVDKKGKGWKPGEDSFPSNGRIAWALWGGDAAWRWARAIVERENKKSLTAGGYALPGYHDSVDTYRTSDDYDANIDAFKDAYELDENYGPEFMARVCMDGSGVDRLYKIDLDGKVCVWDDGRWDDLGHVDGDVWLYDNALDDEYDHVEKDHFLIDPESAIYISAMLQQNPYGKVRIEDMDPDEANLVARGLMDEDLQMLDYALVAAGDSMSGAKGKGSVKAGDGQYTEAERSAIASQAPRDATGKFAKAGGRAVIGNDAAKGAGVIVGRSKTPGNIQFKLDSTGKTIDIPAKYSTPEDKFVAPKAPSVDYGKPLNVEGILGEPRTPQSMPNAQLPGTLPPMSSGDLKNVLNDWDGYVAEQRASFKPLTDKQVRQYAKDTNQKVREVGSETRTPLPGQKKGPTGSLTTVKDGKLTTQSGPAPKSGGNAGTTRKAPTSAGPAAQAAPATPAAEAGPVAQAQGVGKAKAFKPADNLLPGSPNMSKVTAPGAKTTPVIPKPDKNIVGYEQLPGSPNMAKPIYGDKKTAKDTRNPADAGRYPGYTADQNKSKPAAKSVTSKSGGSKSGGSKGSTGGTFTKDGQYVIQKGDNLWALAEKYKPKGETTASYWNKVMKANPKGNFKSGNPSLIYSGEKVNLPGVTGPAAPSKPSRKFGDDNRDSLKPKAPRKFGDDNRDSLKPKPAKPSSDERRDSLKPKPATPGKPSSDERRDSLKPKGGKDIVGYETLPGAPNMARPVYGDKKTAKPSSDERRDSLKPKARPSTDERRDSLKPKPGTPAKPTADERRDSLKPKPKADAKPSSDERRDSVKPKVAKPSSDERRDSLRAEPKPFLDKPVKSEVPKSLQKPAGPATPRQADGPAKRTTSDPKDRGIAPGKPAPKPFLDKPVQSGVPKSLQKPAPRKQSGGSIVKRGKSGTRKRNLPEG